MTRFQLTMIGLGQIGASFGLALKARADLVERVGYDSDPEVARHSRKIGAVDRIAPTPEAAVQGADLVLLALPMDQIRPVMEQVGPRLKIGVVLMDTVPVKEAPANWARELLPEGCSYVGLTPTLNPRYLHSDTFGIDAAQEDLFKGGLIAIAAPPQAQANGIKLAADLARLVGAEPLFVDLLEIDGLITSTHILPQLLGAALLNATFDQPGWRDARKMAGRAYAEVSGPIVHLGTPGSLAATALLNQQGVLRVLDSVIAALKNLRADIEQGDSESLTLRLERARTGRELWWQQRQEASWEKEALPAVELPTTSSRLGSLLRFGGSKKTK